MAAILGIMITRHENLDHIMGTVRAARAAGKEVMIFMTDEGVQFTRDPKFLELLTLGGVEISTCEYSCEKLGILDRTEGIFYGSQYHNARMLHKSARVLVF